VHHGALAVERVHQRVARTPLELLAHVPPLASGARRFAACHAAVIGATYAAVRGVNAIVGTVAAVAIELAADGAPDAREPAPPADPP
jgi:hypothetical protein